MLSKTVAVDHPFPWATHPSPEIPVGRLKLREYHLDCHMFHVIDLRLQEGFQLHNLVVDESTFNRLSSALEIHNFFFPPMTAMASSHAAKGEVAVRLRLGWQPEIHIEYWLTSSLTSMRKSSAGPSIAHLDTLYVRIYLAAHRDFLHRLDSQNRHVRARPRCRSND